MMLLFLLSFLLLRSLVSLCCFWLASSGKHFQPDTKESRSGPDRVGKEDEDSDDDKDMEEDEEEDDEEESSGEEDDGPGLLALNGNIADLENEEEDRDYDKTGDHEDDDDDVKDEEG